MAKTKSNVLRELALPVFLPSLIFSIGENLLIPLIPAGAERLGADLGTASIIAGMIFFGTLVADVPAAKLIRRIGERLGMIYASVAAALGLVVTALATNLYVMSAGVLLVGAGASVFALARHTFIAATVPFEVRARALSLLGGMFRAGSLIGPLIAAGLLVIGDFHTVYWASLILCLVAAVLVWFTKRDKVADSANQTNHSTWHITKREWKKLSTLGTASALLAIVRTARTIGLPIWALYINLEPVNIALLVGLAASLDVMLFYTSGQVMDKWGRRAAAVPTMVLLGITMFLVPLSSDFNALLLVALAMSLANGLGSGLIMVLGADLAPADARGEFLAAFRLIIDGSTSVTAPILSLAAVTVGLGFGFFLFGAMSLTGAWLMWKHIPTHIMAPKKRL
ncbi:MAG: MFS transporter [Rhodoluna sp.]|nr:MFS transporter [Rhodoluna sp.]